MKTTKKVVTEKKVSNVDVKIETAKKSIFDNENLQNRLSAININVLQTVTNAKKSLYLYPSLDEVNGIDESKRKSERKKYRNIKTNFCKNIISAYNSKNAENFDKIANDFIDFYKKTFLITDFEVSNFHNLQIEKKTDLILLYTEGLNLLKEYVSMNK